MHKLAVKTQSKQTHRFWYLDQYLRYRFGVQGRLDEEKFDHLSQEILYMQEERGKSTAGIEKAHTQE
jgi:hypothetical protein